MNSALQTVLSQEKIPNTEPDEDEEDEDEKEKKKSPCDSVLFSRKAVNTALINKIEKHYSNDKGTPVSDIRERLNFIQKIYLGGHRYDY